MQQPDMKNSDVAPSSSYKPYIVITLLFIFSLWKFYPSLGLGVTVSQAEGDGLGTIAWMTDVAVETHKQPLSYLFSDMTTLDGRGLGAFPDVPINSVQKVIVYIVSFIAQFDDIYDIYGLLGFFLVGVSSYYLLREFGVSHFLALLGAFLLMNNDNFYTRISGHLTLAIPFAPIILMLVVVKLSKTTSLVNMLRVATLIAFNFSMNEYYGYYGALFSVALFIGLYCFYQPLRTLPDGHIDSLVKNIMLSSVFFVLLMSFLYPNLIGGKIVGLFSNHVGTGAAEASFRSYQDFLGYSINNHWYLFFSPDSFLVRLIGDEFFTTGVISEQSFRVGIIIPIVILVVLTAAYAGKFSGAKSEKLLLLYTFIPTFILVYEHNFRLAVLIPATFLFVLIACFIFKSKKEKGNKVLFYSLLPLCILIYAERFRIDVTTSIVVLISMSILVFVVMKLIKRSNLNDNRLLLIFAFMPACVLIYLLSNDPRTGWSLVDFTYQLTGIFRVSSRAYLYVFLMLITLFIIYLDVIFKSIKALQDRSKYILFIVSAALVVLVLDDATQKSLWAKQASVYQLPETDFYQDLAEMEEGRVLELPFYHFPEDPFEKGYPLGFYRSIYQFELVNAILPTNNSSYNGYTALYELLKKPDDAIGFIRSIGVKYIVVSSSEKLWYEGIDGLTLLKQYNGRKLFQVEEAVSVGKSDALKMINELALVLINEGDEVYFNTKESRALLRKGFTTTEDWGVWSESKVAEIYFKHPVSIGNSEVILTYRVFGDVTYEQNIIFYINGERIQSVYNTQSGVHEITLPVKNNDSKIVDIRLEIPTAISPSELYLNNPDYRKLGIGLIKMKYQKEKI